MILNSTGGSTGNQRLGGVTVKNARVPVTTYPVQNDGDFREPATITIDSVTGIYQDRFDDVGYYE